MITQLGNCERKRKKIKKKNGLRGFLFFLEKRFLYFRLGLATCGTLTNFFYNSQKCVDHNHHPTFLSVRWVIYVFVLNIQCSGIFLSFLAYISVPPIYIYMHIHTYIPTHQTPSTSSRSKERGNLGSRIIINKLSSSIQLLSLPLSLSPTLRLNFFSPPLLFTKKTKSALPASSRHPSSLHLPQFNPQACCLYV